MQHLPRLEQMLEPQSTQCPCGCGEMVRIGEDRTERLDIVAAQLRIIVTVRAVKPRYDAAGMSPRISAYRASPSLRPS